MRGVVDVLHRRDRRTPLWFMKHSCNVNAVVILSKVVITGVAVKHEASNTYSKGHIHGLSLKLLSDKEPFRKCMLPGQGFQGRREA